MKNYFPPQGQNFTYLQTNRSDVLGSIWASSCIDLQSNLMRMRVGTKLRPNTTTAQQSNLGLPYAFKAFDGRFFAICGARVFKNTDRTVISAFVEDASTNFVTNYAADRSDMEVFNGVLVTTTGSKIFTKDADSSGTGSWTDRGNIDASYHKLVYFKKFDKIYYTALDTQVRSMNADFTLNTSGDYTIQLGAGIGITTTLAATSNSIWIGTVRASNNSSNAGFTEKASVLEWDGISAQITREYLIDAQAILAITIRDDIPYIMDSNGVLRKYTGSSFVEVGRLPLIESLLQNATDQASGTRFIHPNGLITTKNNTIMALIDSTIGDNALSVQENLPAGLWEWSEDYGFTHRSALTYQPLGSSTITDYGQTRLSVVGALANANVYSESSSGRGTILVGCTYFTNASSTTNAIFIDSPIPVNGANTPEGIKKGYFITTWFQSQEVQDKWSRIWAIYRQFTNSSDKIVFKYRISEEDPVQATITWTSTTTFTTTTDVSAYWTSGTGYEVEVLNGTGAGTCAHITSIVNNAGTYTVTIDTVATGVTNGTAVARFQKWIKVFPEITGQLNSFTQMPMDASNTEIQIKCCLTFYGEDEFDKFILVSNEDIKATL